MGLLDEFINTPAGIGLLSAMAGGLAGARKGTPLNNIGRGAVTGLAGYQGAQDQIRLDKNNAFDQKVKQSQMDKIQAEIDQKRAMQTASTQAAQSAMVPGSHGPMGYKPTDPQAFADQFAQGSTPEDQEFNQANMGAIAEGNNALAPEPQGRIDHAAYRNNMAQNLYAAGMGEEALKFAPDPKENKPQLVTVYGADGRPMQKWVRPGEAEGVDVGMGKQEVTKSTWQDGGDKLYEMNAQGQPTGNTLPKAMQPNMQFVPGSDYKPSGVFNPRTGQFSATEGGGQEPTMQPDSMAPWAGMPPKKADEMRSRMYATESKKLDDLREQVTKGREVVRELDRFGTLNREQGTGGVSDRITSLPTFDAEKREMESISSRLAPFQRAPGSGASSDRDVSLFLQGLPGIDKQGTVNKNIRTQYQQGLKEAETAVDFAERYFAEKGHLNGWNAAYKASKGKNETRDDTGGSIVLSQAEIKNMELQDAVARGDTKNAEFLRRELRSDGMQENKVRANAKPKTAKDLPKKPTTNPKYPGFSIAKQP